MLDEKTHQEKIADTFRVGGIARKATAYHEAGHAATHFFFGCIGDLIRIDMVGNDANVAFVRSGGYYQSPDIIRLHLDFDRRDGLARARRAMLHCLAGRAAQARLEHDPEWLMAEMESEEFDDPSTDIGHVGVVARLCYPTEGRQWQLIRRAAGLTDEFVADPKIWKVIEALADVLCQRDHVDGFEAFQIMQGVWGDHPPPVVTSSLRRWFCPDLKVG